MASNFDSLFMALQAILQRHASEFRVTQDTAENYCLEAVPGPATLRAWGGKMKRPTIPVAWVSTGKAYVGYHLMGLDGNAKVLDGMSRQLKARVQGKTCFNFKSKDDALFAELAELTRQTLSAFCKQGFALEHPSAETKGLLCTSLAVQQQERGKGGEKRGFRDHNAPEQRAVR